MFAGGSTVFNLPEEHVLKFNHLLTTLPILTEEWRVSFEVNPENYTDGFAQVLHMTTGGRSSYTPALWFSKSYGIYIRTTMHGMVEYSIPKEKLPIINEWTTVEISQTKRGSEYIFSLVIKDETLLCEENTNPSQFSNVQVFASSGWQPAQEGSIRRFQIENNAAGAE